MNILGDGYSTTGAVTARAHIAWDQVLTYVTAAVEMVTHS